MLSKFYYNFTIVYNNSHIWIKYVWLNNICAWDVGTTNAIFSIVNLSLIKMTLTTIWIWRF